MRCYLASLAVTLGYQLPSPCGADHPLYSMSWKKWSVGNVYYNIATCHWFKYNQELILGVYTWLLKDKKFLKLNADILQMFHNSSSTAVNAVLQGSVCSGVDFVSGFKYLRLSSVGCRQISSIILDDLACPFCSWEGNGSLIGTVSSDTCGYHRYPKTSQIMFRHLNQAIDFRGRLNFRLRCPSSDVCIHW